MDEEPGAGTPIRRPRGHARRLRAGIALATSGRRHGPGHVSTGGAPRRGTVPTRGVPPSGGNRAPRMPNGAYERFEAARPEEAPVYARPVGSAPSSQPPDGDVGFALIGGGRMGGQGKRPRLAPARSSRPLSPALHLLSRMGGPEAWSAI